jgi:hypothetical protein
VSSILSAPSSSRARPIAPQPHQPTRERLDPQPLRERRDQHHPRVTDDPLVVEFDPHAVQSDRPVIMHHQGDLLSQAPAAAISR